MKDGWPEAGSVNCEREPVAYATDATVPRVSVLQGIENFLQDISLADGRGAPQLPAHTLGSSSQTKFILPAALFNSAHPPSPSPSLSPLQLHGRRRMHLHRLSLTTIKSFRKPFPILFEFRIPPSDNSTSSPHRPNGQQPAGTGQLLFLRIGGSRKKLAHPTSSLARPRLQILLPSLVLCSPRVPPLIGRSCEGWQRPPPSSSTPHPLPGRKAATCDPPSIFHALPLTKRLSTPTSTSKWPATNTPST